MDLEMIKHIGKTRLFQLLKHGQYKQAILYLDTKLQKCPRSKLLWLQKAFVYRVSCSFFAAAKCYDMLIALDPNNPHALIWKGNKFRCLFKYSEALDCYEQMLKINPDNISALNNKAAVLAKLGNAAKALKCYEQILKRNPNNAMTWLNKAKLELEFFMFPSAIESLEKFQSLVKKNPLSRAKLKQWRIKIKNFEEHYFKKRNNKPRKNCDSDS